MIRADGKALAFEKGGEGFRPMLQRSVNDSRLNGRFLDLLEDVFRAIVCGDRSDYKIEICSIEGQLVVVLRLNLKVFTNIICNLRGGCCSETKNTRNFEFAGKTR